MKKRIFGTLIIASLFAITAQAQNKFVSVSQGSDSNGGTSWGDAYLTLGKLNGNLSAGDTAICVGTFTETFAPTFDGAAGNKIVVMDSLSYTNGLNLTNPDTANLWSAIIDGQSSRTSGISLNDADYLTIIGFDVVNHNSDQIVFVGDTDGTLILQTRVRLHGDGSGNLVNVAHTGDADSLVSCLLLGDNTVNRAINYTSNTGTGFVMLNNTIYGNFDFFAFITDDSMPLEMKNNIIWNISSVSNDHAGHFSSTGMASVSDWDNNLWYAPNVINTWDFNGAAFDLVATYIDSVNNHDADGEANALNLNPGLSNLATTASSDENSAVYGSAENNAFNDANDPSIGYYQHVAGCNQIIVVQ